MRELAAIWTNRHLVSSLARQDLRRVQAGTVGGLAWAVLTPLLPLLIFTTVFAFGLRLPLGGAPYALGFAAAYVPWALMSASISGSVGSIVERRNLVKYVRFPLQTVSASSIVVSTLPHFILVALTVAATLSSGHARLPELLLLPYFYACAVALVFGVGLTLSALAVIVRDIQQLAGSLLNVWFWITPIAWASGALTPGGQALLALNPAAYVVSGYRYALMPESFPAPSVTATIAFWILTACFIVIGAAIFRRLQPHFWECL
jgi:teichoic acid transport system permease protein